MTFLVSPTEPQDLLELLGNSIVSQIPEDHGVDLLALIPKPEGVVKLGLQRKRVPEDFWSSIEDGRLSRELVLMRDLVTFPILVLEGRLRFNSDGRLYSPKNPRFPYRINRRGIRNLLRSCWVQFGVQIEHSEGLEDTVAIWEEWTDYVTKEKHTSLLRRPSIYSEWGTPSVSERELYWVQGFRGIGVEIGANLLQKLSPIELCNSSIEELMIVDKIGRVRAEGIYNFLRRM
ncbi:MAG: hypothetical protein KKB37_17390, partial [Alphaproteobacteria bacterium]|nr:hypothetical protein [Alphaproteobacteria bacterium]